MTHHESGMPKRHIWRMQLRHRLLREHPHCLYCGKHLTRKTATLDHIVPLAQSGADSACNLCLCCESCNTCKNNRTISQWISDLSRALTATLPDVRLDKSTVAVILDHTTQRRAVR
jgi:5-methylcytosine-specific restriction endonuclease McrA